MKIPITYTERAAKLNGQAGEALLAQAKWDWERARAAVNKAAEVELLAMNALRQMGIRLQEAAGRERIGFEWFHAKAGELPADFSFDALRFCVGLARGLAAPAAKLDECRHARQAMFEVFGQSKRPRRAKKQKAHERNPWSEFVSGASTVESQARALGLDRMASWTPEQLGKFLRTLEPLVERHQEASRLAEGNR